MKKALLIAISFLIVFLFAVACGSPSAEPSEAPAIEEEATQTITNQTTGEIEEKLQALTEEGDFKGVVNLLDTPEKIVEYMSRNFLHYVDKYDKPLGYYDPHMPEDFFHVRVGNCEDFSAFASYVLDEHGYDVFLFYYIAQFLEPCPTYGDILEC